MRGSRIGWLGFVVWISGLANAEEAPPVPAPPAVEARPSGAGNTPQTAGPDPAAPPARRSTPIEAVYEDGFKLRTQDGRHELRIGASAHLDSRFYFGDTTSPDAFDIRRARFEAGARLFDGVLEMQVQAALEDRPFVRSAWLDVRVSDAFRLKAGQMKVPFSTEWLTAGSQLNFLERGTGQPFYPFFDRGIMIHGTLAWETIQYAVGIFAGAGLDFDATHGDLDGSKDVAWRLFLQPFRNAGVPWLSGLYLVGQGTFGYQSVPARRFETGGLATPTYESLVWRWRTEQVLGDNGRNRDLLAATIGSRTRFGAEVLFLYGPWTFSAEWDMVRYRDIEVFHEFWQGSKRLKHERVLARDGDMHCISVWTSWFVTGESKTVNNFGFRQPKPASSLGQGGFGSIEVLARFSATFTDRGLFDTQKVKAFSQQDFNAESGFAGPPVAEGASVTASVLDGAYRLYELTAGLNWNWNAHVRFQMNYLYLWDPEDGPSGIVSAGRSDLSDATRKNRLIKSEHSLGVRLIFKI